MQMYADTKAKLPADTLLLFRLGDFYEAFNADAVTIAKALEITLTNRKGVPMAGIPYHCADAWFEKLVGMGHKVATANEQASA